MSGKLICSDGTEVEISKETEENMRKRFGKRNTFEKIRLCHLRVDVEDEENVLLTWKSPTGPRQEERNYCSESITAIGDTITALQSAIDYIKGEKKV